VLIDGDGRPVCSAMWPSNTRRCHQPGANDPADAPAFSVGRACIVADCGMISAETIAALEAPLRYSRRVLPGSQRHNRPVLVRSISLLTERPLWAEASRRDSTSPRSALRPWRSFQAASAVTRMQTFAQVCLAAHSLRQW
jgi:hypothetical protein